ncbi:MAG: pyridoxamine 5'-phosphate oxidase family protein [Acidimicrobiales bacterium]
MRWGDFANAAPELAAFGAGLFAGAPSYLATVGADGGPRVHPVTPVIGTDDLFVFMEPTSPKGRDLVERRRYALHNGVPDSAGTGGELLITGTGQRVDDPMVRAGAVDAAAYAPADRYILFRLDVRTARAGGHGDVELPDPKRWTDPA